MSGLTNVTLLAALSALNANLFDKLYLTPEQLKLARDSATTCFIAYGVSAVITSIPDPLKPSNESPANCFAKCLFQNYGSMSEEGDYYLDMVKAMLPQTKHKYVDECGAIKGVDLCDKADKGFKCITFRLI